MRDSDLPPGYVSHKVFGRLVGNRLDKEISTEQVRKVLWYAQEVDRKGEIDTKFHRGKPYIRSSKGNLDIFLELRELQLQRSRRNQRRLPDIRFNTQSPVEYPTGKSGIERLAEK